MATTVAVPFIIVAVVVMLLASGPAARLAYARPGFPPPVGMSSAERLDLATATTRFIAGRGSSSALEELALANAPGDPLYSAPEVRHLADVRLLIRRAVVTGLAAVSVVIAAWLTMPRPIAARAIARGGRLTIVIVVLLAIGIAFAWPWLFTAFHELLFPPDTWTFAADSGLIRLFPMAFWRDAAIALAVLLALLGLITAAVGDRVAAGTRTQGE